MSVNEFQTGNNIEEDDFKVLQVRALGEIYDDQFKDFSKWMRQTYTKTYTMAKMRNINRHELYQLVSAFALSISFYVYLRYYYFDYVLYWWLPFFLWSLLWVTQKNEVVHSRAHWATNMTGYPTLDKVIDYSMIALTGTSKETFRRRHVAAHYADIANVARLFSDVWLPFVTLPPVFYVIPHYLYYMVTDEAFLKKEKMNRNQLIIEMFVLYSYMIALVVELFFGSFWLLCFHMVPLMYFSSTQIISATLAHSGIDKRNSFNSNGLFDPDECKGLFKISLFLLGIIGNWGVINHAIHHAYSLLPLCVVNDEYKFINRVCLDRYKHVRYNQVLSHITNKASFDLLPEPRWYDYVGQVIFDLICINAVILSIMGLPFHPVIFEPGMVDYRVYLYNPAERYAGIVGLWKTVQLEERIPERKEWNAYFWVAYKRMRSCEEWLAKHSPQTPIPRYDNEPNSVASPEVMNFMIKNRGRLQ